MSKVTKVFIAITVFYLIFYSIDVGWWALIMAPITALIAICILAVAPLMHRFVFDDSLFEITTPESCEDD